MIRTIRVCDINKAIEKGWTIWFIARSSGGLQKMIDEGKVVSKPAFAPSYDLLKQVEIWKKEGKWNEKTFSTEYVPLYFKEKANDKQFNQTLNELFLRSQRGENIALACFCGNISTCHRSIILGLMQAYQAECIGPEFSPYAIYYWFEKKSGISSQA